MSGEEAIKYSMQQAGVSPKTLFASDDDFEKWAITTVNTEARNIYKRFNSKVAEGFNLEIIRQDFLAEEDLIGDDKYNIFLPSEDDQVIGLFVKYQEDTSSSSAESVKVSFTGIDQKNFNIETLRNREIGGISAPEYTIIDNKLYIWPLPLKTVPNGIELRQRGSYKEITEIGQTILGIPEEQQDLLFFALKIRIFERVGDEEGRLRETGYLEAGITKSIIQLQDRGGRSSKVGTNIRYTR